MAQVLVVDDSSTVRNEVCGFLTANGLTVTHAMDGRDGLEKMKADPSIRLALCDVNMPNMDGLTMAEKIRRPQEQRGEHHHADHGKQPGDEGARQGRRYQRLDCEAL